MPERLRRRFLIMRYMIVLLVLLATIVGESAPAEQVREGEKADRQQYLRRFVTPKVYNNWIPCRTPKVIQIEVEWKIHRDGTISDLRVCDGGKALTAEKRAVNAVLKSAPFMPRDSQTPEYIQAKVLFKTTTQLQLTVPQAVNYYGADARKVLAEKCRAAKVVYPPKRLTLIALKHERKLLLFAEGDRKCLIGVYPLVSYSGILGPKLREGDLQIPEGVYRVTGFQAYNMLALRINYPNELDRQNAKADKRTKLGGDILIHGGSQSTGCLVVSEEDMEQLFVAVHDVGCNNTELIIAPCNLLRYPPIINLKRQPSWVPALYESVRSRMSSYPVPHKT